MTATKMSRFARHMQVPGIVSEALANDCMIACSAGREDPLLFTRNRGAAAALLAVAGSLTDLLGIQLTHPFVDTHLVALP